MLLVLFLFTLLLQLLLWQLRLTDVLPSIEYLVLLGSPTKFYLPWLTSRGVIIVSFSIFYFVALRQLILILYNNQFPFSSMFWIDFELRSANLWIKIMMMKIVPFVVVYSMRNSLLVFLLSFRCLYCAIEIRLMKHYFRFSF